MSERWETVPVSREVREALWKWAKYDVGDSRDNYLLQRVKVAARQFREDVLAEEPES